MAPTTAITCSGLGPGFPDEIERGVEETGNDGIAVFLRCLWCRAYLLPCNLFGTIRLRIKRLITLLEWGTDKRTLILGGKKFS